MNTPIKDLVFAAEPETIRCVIDENAIRHYLSPDFKPDPALRYRWFADNPAYLLKDQPQRLYCSTFPVIRQTAKTEWLSLGYGAERRQLRYAVRKFAHTHPGAALYSFIRKRNRYKADLAAKLRQQTAIVEAAEKLAQTTDLSQWKSHPDVGVDYPVPEYRGSEWEWQ